MIQASLNAGRSVFYKSTGSSMWPLVQSEDACTFHPIQAVTAKGGKFSIQKEASEIEVGDIVFCQVQPSQLFYAHIVHKVERIYVPIGRSTRSGTFRGASTAGVTGSTSSASSLLSRCFRMGSITCARIRR